MPTDDPTCTAEVFDTDDDGERTGGTHTCGAAAPTHGVTLWQADPDGGPPVSLGRKPICDEHYEALKAQQGGGG